MTAWICQPNGQPKIWFLEGRVGIMGEMKDKKTKVDDQTLLKIREEIEKIQYGSVTVVIHDGKIVQLDTNTKIRLI